MSLKIRRCSWIFVLSPLLAAFEAAAGPSSVKYKFDIEPQPAGGTFFYAFVGFTFSHATIAVFSFGTFVAPRQAEFGWNRGEVAFVLPVDNLAVMLVAPLLGVLTDRFGVRRILLPSLALMSPGVATMTMRNGSLWQFYAMYFFILFLGMATLLYAYSCVITSWFQARRGLALGIALSGIGAGAVLVPVITQALIGFCGWWFAYGAYASADALAAAVIFPAARVTGSGRARGWRRIRR